MPISGLRNWRASVRHQGLAVWGGPGAGSFRLGVRLLDADGRVLGELRGALVPPGVVPGAELTFFLEVDLPQTTGAYHLLLDLVEEGVCWFSERGSTPAICNLAVVAEPGASLRPPDLVEPALAALESAVPNADLAEARAKLASGGAVEDLLVLLRSRDTLPLTAELDLRSRLGAAVGPGEPNARQLQAAR